MSEYFTINGKNAVVTGGNAGLGKAIAEAFLSEGLNVGIMARDEEKLRQTAEELSGLGGNIGSYIVDVSDYGSISPYIVDVSDHASVEKAFGIGYLKLGWGSEGEMVNVAKPQAACWVEVQAFCVAGVGAYGEASDTLYNVGEGEF